MTQVYMKIGEGEELRCTIRPSFACKNLKSSVRSIPKGSVVQQSLEKENQLNELIRKLSAKMAQCMHVPLLQLTVMIQQQADNNHKLIAINCVQTTDSVTVTEQ